MKRELADAAKRLKEGERELADAAKIFKEGEIFLRTSYATNPKYYDRGYDDKKAKRPRNNDWFS